MRVLRIFSDPLGVARTEWREVPMLPDAQGRPTSATFAAERFFFRDTPAGHVHGRHHAPQRQFIFVASGIGEVELDDGSKWRFRPGDMIFAEDTTGHGHVTRSLEGVRGFVYLTVPEEFDVTRWPLVA